MTILWNKIGRIWIVLLLGGCTWFGANLPPEWILSPQNMYPPDQFLIGMGEGDSRSQAEERAYASLARVFTATITSQAMDHESYSIQESDEHQHTRRTLEIDHRTRVTTSKILENVKILDVWYQPSTRHFFALAGLDRQHAEQALLERLSSLDAAIEQRLNQARTHAQKSQRIRGYTQTLDLLRQRREVNNDLRVVRRSGEHLPPFSPLSEVQREFLDFVANELIISVEIEGEHHEELERAILEGLKQEGLLGGTVKSNLEAQHQAEDLAIQGRTRLWTVDLPDPLFTYVRWCADLDIYEYPSQRLIGVISQTGREGHITEQEAKIRASHAMQEVVAREVAVAFTRSALAEPGRTVDGDQQSRACP